MCSLADNPAEEGLTMIAELPEIRQQTGLRVSSRIIASLKGVSKNYGDVRALKNVDLGIRAGELLALLGPNGAGKTTAVRLLLGLAKPSSGSVNIFGGNPVDAEFRRRTGAMLQVAKVPETLKVREHIDLFSSYYPHPLPLAETLAIAGIEQIKNRNFGELSGGQRQRVLFALAICGDPDLLFLDEPTVSLDVEARRLLWEEIRKLVERGKTVLLTTHYLQEADELADRVVVINQGAIIAEGTPGEIKAKTAGKKIRCVTRIPVDVISSLPQVLKVSHDRGALEIQVSEAEPVMRELLRQDSQLSGLEISSAGLEDAFLALTQEDKSVIEPTGR
jgi:ABC-2 type transport system ATP-binding protein